MRFSAIKPAAANPAITAQLYFGHHGREVAEVRRMLLDQATMRHYERKIDSAFGVVLIYALLLGALLAVGSMAALAYDL